MSCHVGICNSAVQFHVICVVEAEALLRYSSLSLRLSEGASLSCSGYLAVMEGPYHYSMEVTPAPRGPSFPSFEEAKLMFFDLRPLTLCGHLCALRQTRANSLLSSTICCLHTALCSCNGLFTMAPCGCARLIWGKPRERDDLCRESRTLLKPSASFGKLSLTTISRMDRYIC